MYKKKKSSMSWDLKLVNTNRIHLITTDSQKIKQDFHNQNIKIKKICFHILCRLEFQEKNGIIKQFTHPQNVNIYFDHKIESMK